MTAVHTGLRRGNLLALRWDEVDLANEIIRVQRAKNGRSHAVPLDKTALGEFRQVAKKTGHLRFVFAHLTGNQAGLPIADVKNAFRSAVDDAKIRNFRFHDLRHIFGTWLAMRGVDIYTIKELMGHRSVSQTMRYAHLSPNHKARQVAVLDQGAVESLSL